MAVWEGSCVRCELLAVRAQEPWRVCRLGDVTYTRFAQLGLRLRGSVRFEVRGRRVCRLRCYVCVRVCACVVSCCPACILLIVPVAAPAILSFSMRVLCVFIDLLRSPSLRRDGVDGVDGVDCACGCAHGVDKHGFGIARASPPPGRRRGATQGATPTCPRPRMCVYCLLCMSNRRQSLSQTHSAKLKQLKH